MCTACQNHCSSCCTNHGGVYPHPCLVAYQLRPNQQAFIQISHPIDEQNPKLVLETCDRCKWKEQKHSWLKSIRANLSQLFWIKSLVLGNAEGEGNVMSNEDLVEARAKRVEKETAYNVCGMALEVSINRLQRPDVAKDKNLRPARLSWP